MEGAEDSTRGNVLVTLTRQKEDREKASMLERLLGGQPSCCAAMGEDEPERRADPQKEQHNLNPGR